MLKQMKCMWQLDKNCNIINSTADTMLCMSAMIEVANVLNKCRKNDEIEVNANAPTYNRICVDRKLATQKLKSNHMKTEAKNIHRKHKNTINMVT